MISSSSPLNLRDGDCEIAPEFKKSMSWKTLSEDISELINCGDEFDHEILSKNSFSDKVEINLNVFGSSMEDWVRGNSQGGDIITPQNRWISEINAKVFEKGMNPTKLCRNNSQGSILRFNRGSRDSGLFLCRLGDCIIAQVNQEARSGPAII
jgi:hypothetical protein